MASEDEKQWAAWRGPSEDQEFRARLKTTRDNLTTTLTQLNAYVAELDDVLKALLEADQRKEEENAREQ